MPEFHDQGGRHDAPGQIRAPVTPAGADAESAPAAPVPFHQRNEADRWKRERDTLSEIRANEDTPREKFPGDKTLFLLNLRSWLGHRFVPLLAERDALVAQLDGARGILNGLSALGMPDPRVDCDEHLAEAEALLNEAAKLVRQIDGED